MSVRGVKNGGNVNGKWQVPFPSACVVCSNGSADNLAMISYNYLYFKIIRALILPYISFQVTGIHLCHL